MVEQTFTVTSSNSLLTYNYAVVLNDGGHPDGYQPYFHAEVLDSTGHVIPGGCSEYYVQAAPTGQLPAGFISSSYPAPSDGAVYYLPWKTNTVNLTSYMGKKIKIRFTAAGCPQGYHTAWAYVDASCGPVQITTSNTNVCAGTPVTLTAPLVQGGSYSWSGPGIVSSSGNVAVVNAGGSYSVQITPPNAACAYNVTTSFNYLPVPGLSVSSVSPSCAGDAIPAILFTSTPSGSTVSWTNNNTAVGIGASGTGNIPSYTAPLVSATTSATITATPSANGCSGNPVSFNIQIKPKPVLNTIPSQVYCSGSRTLPVNFSSVPSGAGYNWVNNNTITGLAASGTGDIPAYLSPSSTDSLKSTITVTPSLNGCNGTPKSFLLLIKPTPVLDVFSGQTVCSGGTINGINFQVTPTNAMVNWTNNNTAIGLAASGAGNITSYTAPVSNVGIQAILTAQTSLNGCTGNSGTANISVKPQPLMSNVPNTIVCAGSAVPGITFSALPSGTSFNWTNNNAATGLANS